MFNYRKNIFPFCGNGISILLGHFLFPILSPCGLEGIHSSRVKGGNMTQVRPISVLCCPGLSTGSRIKPWCGTSQVYQSAFECFYKHDCKGGANFPLEWPRGWDGKLEFLASILLHSKESAWEWSQPKGRQSWDMKMGRLRPADLFEFLDLVVLDVGSTSGLQLCGPINSLLCLNHQSWGFLALVIQYELTNIIIYFLLP